VSFESFGVNAKEDTFLPAPVSIVLDFNVVEGDTARHALENDGGVANDDGALHLVFALAFPAAVLLLLGLVEVGALKAHLVEEAADHVLPVLGLLHAVFFRPLFAAVFALLFLLLVLLLPLLFCSLPSFFHLLPVGLVSRLLVLITIIVEHSDNH